MRFVCAILFSFVIYENGETLSWSRTYSYEAILTIPESNIVAPYSVWVDGQTGNTRVDFYNGLDKLYRLRLFGSNLPYIYFKVHPEVRNNSNNLACSRLTHHDLIYAYDLNCYLPVSDFEYEGIEQENGENLQKWKSTSCVNISGYNLSFTNILWVSYKVQDDEIVTVPVRYIYKSQVGDVVIDHYKHEYIRFSTSEIDNVIFELPEGLECSSRPTSMKYEYVEPLLEFFNPTYKYDKIHEEFERFITRHNKSYADANEYFWRLKTFRNNLRYINWHNKRNSTYSVALNHLADFSVDEITAVLGSNYPGYEDNDNECSDDEDNLVFGGVLASFDWREYQAVGSVKDQTTMCNACYAFAAAAVVESALFIKNQFRHFEEVSEQAIIDCSWRSNVYGNYGCLGGNSVPTFLWMKNYGIHSKSQYGSYLAMEGLCHISNATKLGYLKKYSKIRNDVNTIKKTLRKRGPLMVTIDISQYSFIFYSGGVYSDSNCKIATSSLRHGLVLIGYGREKDEEYWILKNSFGERWGEDGFVRIAIKGNVCGVASYVYSVEV